MLAREDGASPRRQDHVSMSEATRIGAVLAGYRVESLLGRGGMSVVYLAEHVSLGRKVALKVLASPLAHDPSFRERFMRESQRAAGLDHPNVIPIYDAGEVDGGDADGLLYIAMRYVDGPDLRSLLRREGRLGVGRTLYMLEQVASALDAAHDNDLIHRDVKPSNILIAEPSEHVYLTDFGVAKQTSALDLTRTGIFVGTIEYAAPEQIEGLTLDRRTDVYALGCVLYECLAGRPPFERDAEVAVMHAHLTSPPPRLTEVRPDLPKELDRVVARAMAKSRDERFATTPELVDAAHAILRRSSTTSHPVPDRYEEPVAAISVDGSGEFGLPVAETPPPSSAPPPPHVESAPREPMVESPAASTPPPDPPSGRRAPSMPRWGLTAILVALAAIVSATAAYLVARDDGESAAAPPTATDAAATVPEAPLSLAALVPRELWKNCAVQNAPASGAVESAVCLQPAEVTGQNPPDRWQISIFPDSPSLKAAYAAARAAAPKVADGGRCDGTFWGGAGPWAHEGTPPKPGGQRFCYFDGDDAVIVWTHERLGQASHRDILAIAREGDTDHAALFNWWRFWHHRIGKVAS
jgi:serine/threonine-protein kinase